MADRWWRQRLATTFATPEERDRELTSVAAAALVNLFPEDAPSLSEAEWRNQLPRHHPNHVSDESLAGYRATSKP